MKEELSGGYLEFLWLCEELVGVTYSGVTEMKIASTHNQTVEIDFIFVLLISNKLYTATLIITIIPP